MRILLFHQYYLEERDPGGSRWNEMAREWLRLGHEITVIAGMVHAHGRLKRLLYRGRFHLKILQDGVVVHRVHVSESYNRSFSGRWWGYLSYTFWSVWCALFKVKEDFDVVVVTSPPLFAGVSGFFAAVLKRVPMVLEVRDLWPESAIDTGVLKNRLLIRLAFALEKFLYTKSSMVCVLTPAFYRDLVAKRKVGPGKLILIPNAADFRLMEASLRDFDRASFRTTHGFEGYFVILYVGAHGVANDLVRLLRIAAQFQDSDVLFVLMGEGMEKKKLVESARLQGLSNIRFMDAVSKDEVFRFIAAADMGVSVLKKCETFKTVYSNKTFDYMSCRKPVLMGIDGISRELIEEAGAGTFVDPEDTAGFASVIRAYRSDPERVTREGASGYHYVRRYYDREILSRRFIEQMEDKLRTAKQRSVIKRRSTEGK